jgi:protein disulfide-isomerase
MQSSISHANPASLNWETNYEAAVAKSKQLQKPLFLYFSGSDWCRWCIKMEEEVLQNDDFTNLIDGQFIFYKVDFPIRTILPKEQREQNESLKNKFHVTGFPTIILLDDMQNQFAVLNYREGGGKLYGEYVLKLLREHQKFRKDTKNLKAQNGASLEKLYQYASGHGFEQDRQAIIEIGLTQEDPAFFLKAQYRDLLAAGQQDSQEAKNTKDKLLKLDPENKKYIPYDIAIAEFENNAKGLDEQNKADEVVEPLRDYLSKFGARDDKNSWKVEITIAQTFMNKHQIQEALPFAKASYAHAPAREKIQISGVIVDLEHSCDLIGAQEDE